MFADDATDIKAVFRHFDRHGSGVISTYKLHSVLKTLATFSGWTDEDFRILFKTAHAAGVGGEDGEDGYFPYSGFIDWLCGTRPGEEKARQSVMGQAMGLGRKLTFLDPRMNSAGTSNTSAAATAEKEQLTPTRAARMKRSQSTLKKLGVAEVEVLMDRLANKDSPGFTDAQLARLEWTYLRFQNDEHEVYKEDLTRVLKHLGYALIEEDAVKTIADEVNSYATMNAKEFQEFVFNYSEYEKARSKEIFEQFDEDGSGELDYEEVAKFISMLGIVPLRKVVKEALETVDLNGDGVLNFEEAVLLLSVYRASEGFTRSEIEDFQRKFQDLSVVQDNQLASDDGQPHGSILAYNLHKLLMKYFGPQSAEIAFRLQTELMNGGRKHRGVVSAEKENSGMNFHETLVWARRVRDYYFDMYREQFTKFDHSGCGRLNPEEIREVVQTLGYTLSEEAIREALETAYEDGGRTEDAVTDTLDFDEFVNFMQNFQISAGFTRAELDEFNMALSKFDDNGDGDIDVIELGDILRHLGHRTKLQDVQTLISKVDYNHDGGLDYGEFLQLMRYHREEEIARMRAIFEKYEEYNGTILPENLVHALRAADSAADDHHWTGDHDDIPEDAYKQPVDMNRFIELVDQQRKDKVLEDRKRAGFTATEIMRFEQMFNSLDYKRCGVLEPKDVVRLLGAFGLSQPRTVQEQEQLVELLNKARTRASMNGCADVGEMGTGSASFYVIVALIRVLQERDNKEVLEKEVLAAEECRFSVVEVDEFREVFLIACHKEETMELVSKKRQSVDQNGAKTLTKSGLRRLMQSLGIMLTPELNKELYTKINDIVIGGADIDFPDFLRLMRWVLETNFGGLNDLSPKAG
mmetsp:Transcript_33008/g.77139  ORF Transcript_33008/g.77139 Transcript_33008/m.77139 type:complete len:863 (+) Transcript_33008:71-2659(+)